MTGRSRRRPPPPCPAKWMDSQGRSSKGRRRTCVLCMWTRKLAFTSVCCFREIKFPTFSKFSWTAREVAITLMEFPMTARRGGGGGGIVERRLFTPKRHYKGRSPAPNPAVNTHAEQQWKWMAHILPKVDLGLERPLDCPHMGAAAGANRGFPIL